MLEIKCQFQILVKLLAIALLLDFCASTPVFAQSYSIRALGPPPGNPAFQSGGLAINNRDEVLAEGESGPYTITPSMFLLSPDYGMPSGLDYLPFFGLTNMSIAALTNGSDFIFDIVYTGVYTGILGNGHLPGQQTFNDQGQILGTLQSPTNACIWRNGRVTSLGSLGGGVSYPFAINQNGDVIGYSSTVPGSTNRVPFIVLAGTTNMQTIAGTDANSVLIGFNSRRQVLFMELPISYVNVFISQDGAVQRAADVMGIPNVVLPTATDLNGTFTQLTVNTLNDLGEMSGRVFTAVYTNGGSILSTWSFQSFLYSPLGAAGLPAGVNYDFLPSGGYDNEHPTDLFITRNNNDQMLYVKDYDTVLNTIYFWDQGQAQPLQNLLPPNSGWTNLIPYALNDRGDITGRALSNGVAQAFVLYLPNLSATLTPTPPIAHVGDQILVNITAKNNNRVAPGTVTDVQFLLPVLASGKGGVSPQPITNFPLPATLTLGATVSFSQYFTATNEGIVRFGVEVSGNDPKGNLTYGGGLSDPVNIVPRGDLLIKRAVDPPNSYAGLNVFQTIPIPPQIKTNFVVNTSDISTFQVQIQNNDPNTQTFTLLLNSGGNPVWKQTFLLSGTDVTAQLETPDGLTLPAMAPNSSLVLTVSVQDTNASRGDLNSVELTLGLASDSTVTLDAVEALTQLVPDGDLLIKRDADSVYAGQDIFQTVPAYPQIETNVVALNQDSKFEVQIQNTSTQAQIFSLVAIPSGNTGWMRTYLLGTQDMTSQLEAAGGANLPELAPGDLLALDVIMRATNAPPGDVKRIDFTLASAAGLTLDAVEAVSQLGAPDLAVVSMAWDSTNSGLDFVYTNLGSALSNATTAKIFWATGPTTNDILANLPPIYTVHIPAGFSDQASNQVTEAHFNQPPPNATHVQVVLDPDNLVTETSKTNNALALPLTFRHVVLVMMENRSFDHFLGWLPGADGKQSGLIFTNASGQAYATHDLAPYFQGCGCLLPDQTFGGALAYDNGRCDGWLRANPNDAYTIGYYSQADLPFWGQAATNWTVCDRYFAPLMAETQPNRIYQHAAQTDCLTNRNVSATISGSIGISPITLPTIWDTLLQSNVSGLYYQEGSGPPQTILTLWGYGKYSKIMKSITDFYGDCAAGTLPSVSFVDPLFTAPSWAAVVTGILNTPGYDTIGNDYHPHADIRNGEAFLTKIYNAIASSPQWSSTVLIINFDEWGGFFDHVPPPFGDVTAAERQLGNNGQLGFRVPCMIISPWAKRATVNHMQFDHTSVLKLIENRWGLPALAVRDAEANDLTNVLDFVDPPNYSIPSIDQYATLNAPFGGFCQNIQIAKQPDGTLAAVWDSTCLKVTLQTAPEIDGPWTDQPDILTPPYVFTPIAGSGRALLIRFKVLASGYVTPPL
jgi:phospholipase C